MMLTFLAQVAAATLGGAITLELPGRWARRDRCAQRRRAVGRKFEPFGH
jgi:hypothetical protein